MVLLKMLPVRPHSAAYPSLCAVTSLNIPHTFAYFDELEIFDGMGKFHDDMVDATSDAFYLLNRSQALPQFTLPDLQQSTSYSNLGFSQPDLPIGDAPRIIQGEFQ